VRCLPRPWPSLRQFGGQARGQPQKWGSCKPGLLLVRGCAPGQTRTDTGRILRGSGDVPLTCDNSRSGPCWTANRPLGSGRLSRGPTVEPVMHGFCFGAFGWSLLVSVGALTCGRTFGRSWSPVADRRRLCRVKSGDDRVVPRAPGVWCLVVISSRLGFHPAGPAVWPPSGAP